LFLAILAGIAVISLLVGDRVSIGKIAWLVVGILLGSLWGLRSRLPGLGASDTSATIGRLGLFLVSVLALAVAPTSIPTDTRSGARQRLPAKGSRAQGLDWTP
jgi:hypothetical protein